MTASEIVRLMTPLLEEARTTKFGHITVAFTIRNGEPYGAEIVETRKRWTLQDVPERASVVE